ncbi:MAG: class I adenylate-forming enzyme family protein [Promethearchaeota archaeon]
MNFIGNLSRINARRNPNKEAIVEIETNRRFTWKEFEEITNGFANYLLDFGLKKGDRVALYLNNCAEIILSYFSLPKIGVIVTPLNYLAALEELKFCINDSKPRVLIYSQDYTKNVESLKNKCPTIEQYIPENDFIKIAKKYPGTRPQTEPRINIKKNDVAVFLYTGGTTGKPKAVQLTHNSIINTVGYFISTLFANITQQFKQEEIDNTPDSKKILNKFGDIEKIKLLSSLPIFHIAATGSILLAIMYGATIVILKKFSVKKFLSTIEKEKITIATVVPTILHRIVNYPDKNKYNISSLRQIGYGAAPISPKTIRMSLEFFKNTDFIQIFGQTESTGVITGLSPLDHKLALKNPELLKSAGRVIKGIEVKIVDDNNNELAEGEIGEICIRGNNVMKGYWEQEDLTSKTLVNGWLHSGDLGKFIDGYLYIVGRKKDMVITGGENVYPKEVENVIINYSKVKEVAVIGLPDEDYGEIVVACIVPKEGQHLTEQEIIEFSSRHLAGFKKPKKIFFMKKFPKSAQGKVLKRVLREKYQ